MRMHSEDFIWAMISVFVIALVIGYAIWIRVNNNNIKVIDNCEYIQHYVIVTGKQIGRAHV